MTINRIKLIAIILFAIPLFIITVFRVLPVSADAANAEDPAVTYKAKCAMCHSPKAEKLFDPAKSDADLALIILDGKKAEKGPAMPGYRAKGMTEDEAKALAAYMKSLRAPAN